MVMGVSQHGRVTSGAGDLGVRARRLAPPSRAADATAAAASAASAASAARRRCAAIKQRVSCDQQGQLLTAYKTNATAAHMCAARGCCYDSAEAECYFAAEGVTVDTVHLIQSSHLDIG